MMRFNVFCLLLIFYISTDVVAASPMDSLLLVLDKTIASHASYTDKRETQIRILKGKLGSSTLSDEARYQLNDSLYKGYKAYICDSAIYYLNRNIMLADQMKRPRYSAESRITLSYLLSSTGMYIEAADVLQEVNRGVLEGELLVNYYVAYDRVYGELSHYTQDKRNGEKYAAKSRQYKDSIYLIADTHSDVYLSLNEAALRASGQFDKALAMNDEQLAKARINSPEYAQVMFYRSLTYGEMGDDQQYMHCLALSAIADVRSATKDHASLWMLARALFNQGEFERAYHYMNFSRAATKFCNARLRIWQSTEVLSLIDDTYQMMLQSRNTKLKVYIGYVSCLSLVVLLALFYIYRQMKRLSLARKTVQEANKQLNKLNEELQQMNTCLQSTNIKLAESNVIKERYIARFIKLCSTYVDRLDAYRRMVHQKIVANQVPELLKMSRSDSVLDEALKELYANFDSVFLHIFPDFVKQFNELLREDEQIIVKNVGQLNTELRIFALIRLGITDSSQIAEFLHYSANTIYNYRARVKNKARISRDDFEELLAQIG